MSRQVKLSCDCREKILDETEVKDWPWVRTNYVCMDCKEVIYTEEIEDERA